MRFSCASIFTDHMVLQRRRPVAVFGKGPEGETVEAEFIGHTASTAVRHGEWLLFLPAMDERGAHTLRVRCAGEELAFSDVVLGEVFLAGGQSNMELILENARRIYHELKKPMAARVPTIPGYNDSEENIAATARFVARELGTDVKFHLLPYHRLGGSKHERMEDDADWFDTEPPSKEHMEDLRRLAAGFGLDAVVGG